MNTLTKGIDVSKYQGNIDWQKVKASGVDFAILRAGYGKFFSQKDPSFDRNYENARKAGVKVGAYWYSYAKSTNDAKREAETFLKVLSGKQFEMPVAFDIEESSQAQKGKAFVSSLIKAFCERVENAGYFVSIYASKSWFDNYIDDECKKLYDTWLARWGASPDYNGNIGIWQNSSSGRIDGIAGRCDTDIAYKNYPLIMKQYGLNGFEKQTASQTPSGSKTLSAGTMVSLDSTPLYISATTRNPEKKLSGTYYIYDGKEMNGRYRITSSVSRVNKKPISQNVTGYVKKSDVI